MEGARPAERQDADRCAELCRQALDELRGRRGGALLTRSDTGLVAESLLRPGGLEGLLVAGEHRVLVGTVDGVVVGLAAGHVDDVGETTLGIVDGCYVEPGARGVGVGRALLTGLVSWFERDGCVGVDAPALPGDRLAKNFFEAAGFKARLLTMHHRLG